MFDAKKKSRSYPVQMIPQNVAVGPLNP